MRLIVLQNGAMVADVMCGREPLVLGSAAECRVHLPDTRLAGQQAAFLPDEEGNWSVEPLDLGAELRLNGAGVAARSPLRAGDEVQVLDYCIRIFPDHEETHSRPELGTTRAQLERFAQSKLPPGAIVKKADEPLTLAAGHLLKTGQVHLALARCDTVEALMDMALGVILDAFAAQRAWLGVRRVNYGAMEYVEGRHIAGQTAELPDIGETLKPRVLDRGQFIIVPIVSADERMSVMAGPLTGPDGTLGMIYVDSGDSGRRWDVRDLDHFIALSGAFAAHLDGIFKEQARTRSAMLEGQVIVAHEVQARLTPRKLPQWEPLQFGAFREPGRQRTSDVYDLCRTAAGHAAVMVAHTTASGALPTMLMSQAQAAFRSALMHNDSPQLFLRCLNTILYDGQRDHPLSIFTGLIDPSTGQMRYAMAGRTGAYIIGQRGEERRLGPLEPPPPLSLARDASYPLLSEQLGESETLVLFTPGVTTARNRRGETFGEERFVNILCDGFGQLASAMLKEMLSDLQSFTEGGSQPDDITVVLAHRTG